MFDSIQHWLRFKYGSILVRNERWQEATDVLGRATALDPHHWQSHDQLAIALLKLGRWEGAASAAQRAIKLNPAVSESHTHLGVALLKMARWTEAMVAYNEAITLDPTQESSHEGLGIALLKLGRVDEAAVAYRHGIERRAEASRRGIEQSPGSPVLHERLAGALAMLGRWEEAVAAFRRASDLTPGRTDPFRHLAVDYAGPMYHQIAQLDRSDPSSYANFADAVSRLQSSEETVAAHEQAVALAPDDPAAYLSLGIELSKVERWAEAAAALERGSALAPQAATFHFLRIDPLMRLGRVQEAAQALHAPAVRDGDVLPILPGESAPARFERRRASFWTPENLGPDVPRVERWIEELSLQPQPAQPAATRAPGRVRGSAHSTRLLFVLDNDYGELTTLMYFVLGQPLADQTTLLLPERLYAHNANAIPGRTHRYQSLADVLQMVEGERSDIVFLCSGYLFRAHNLFSIATLEQLVHGLRERGCRVVTTDPFLGMLSKLGPSSLISIDIPPAHPAAGVEQMMERKREDEAVMWDYFSHSERILRGSVHFYPACSDAVMHAGREIDSRNVSFFNAKLVRPPADASLDRPSVLADRAKPHWLFILSRADFDMQALFEAGELRFADIVARKLVETVVTGRHPILVAPKEFVEILASRMPTAEGIDILSYCPFQRFITLLLSAEHAFYWNMVSHSLLVRLFNKLPIVLFDRGHLVRTANALYDRVVQWYYQGWEPTFRDHRQPLTLATVSSWAESYRKAADGICERFRRAPTPEAMVANLLASEATHSS